MAQTEPLVFSNTMALFQVPLAILVVGIFAAFLLGRPLMKGEQPDAMAKVLVVLVACAGLLGAGFYHGVTIDPAKGEVRRSMGWFMLRFGRSWPIKDFDTVAVVHRLRRHQPESGQQSDRRLTQDSHSYVVTLIGEERLAVVQSGSAESAHEDAAAIAAATGLMHDSHTRSDD